MSPLGGKAFPFGESGEQAPREVTIFYKSTMKVSPLGGKAFPFGESGAQAPREVTIFYESAMKVFQLGGTYHKFSAKLGEMPSPRLIVIKIPLKWQRGASLVLK